MQPIRSQTVYALLALHELSTVPTTLPPSALRDGQSVVGTGLLDRLPMADPVLTEDLQYVLPNSLVNVGTTPNPVVEPLPGHNHERRVLMGATLSLVHDTSE